MGKADQAFFGASSRASTGRLRIVGSVWAAALCLGVVLGLFETTIIADDSFYYFEIARNAAQGLGFSFDSIEPTNGFHPLWA
jgi:hypothetical protein